MALPPDDDGLLVTYQGYVCTPEFRYTRSVGLEPNYGYVHVAKADFLEYTIETADGVDAQFVEGLRTVERGAPPPPGRGFRPMGDLVIRETIEGREHTVTFSDVLVAEEGVEAALVTDDGEDIARVALTDIRFLWGSRGFIHAWVNIVNHGAGLVEEGATPSFLPGSLHPRTGRPWTLLQLLTELVLPALPGAPTLRRMPEGLKRAQPLNRLWQPPMLPKAALEDLLEDYSLVLGLDPQGTVSLWNEQEGDPQTQDGRAVDEEIVSSRRTSVSYHYVPPAVLVTGAPVRQTVLIDGLEPVGGAGGVVRPLEESLSLLGMNLFDARVWVMESQERKGAMHSSTQEAISELERWAFRWWRIPGLESHNSDKLPIRDRGVVTDIGAFLPPVVSSETFASFNLAAMLDAGTLVGSAAAIATAHLAEARNVTILANVPYAVAQAGAYEIDRERGIVRFEQPQGHIEPDGGTRGTVAMSERFARVSLEFGFDLKPTINAAATLDHLYHSVWVARADGSPRQVQEIPDGAAIRQVYRRDLVEVRDLVGRTNRALLDSVSLEIARGIFAEPRATGGMVLELHRPAPLVCTGAVRSITWSTEGELPRVRAHVGRAAPFDPRPRVGIVTRARGPLDAGPLDLSRFVPRVREGASA